MIYGCDGVLVMGELDVNLVRTYFGGQCEVRVHVSFMPAFFVSSTLLL